MGDEPREDQLSDFPGGPTAAVLCCAVQCRLKPRLEAMAEHYCSSSSTGISRLLERMKQVGQL
jgi:hypothetical protein